MKKVQKPSNSVCYTPSSEPFRIYSDIFCFHHGDLPVFLLTSLKHGSPNVSEWSMFWTEIVERNETQVTCSVHFFPIGFTVLGIIYEIQCYAYISEFCTQQSPCCPNDIQNLDYLYVSVTRAYFPLPSLIIGSVLHFLRNLEKCVHLILP
jgi:hypothetical protein